MVDAPPGGNPTRVPPGPPSQGKLTVVLGKGGVGRTTVAAALALERARAGERVLLTSVSDTAELERRLAHEGGPRPPDLELVELDAAALVDDLVRRALKLGPITEALLRHPGYESFVAIVPGARELAVLDRVHAARGDHDRVILDGPATGHGLHFLEAPKRAEGLLVGRFKEHVTALREALQDPARTDLVLVTLPEETPVRETNELAAQLRRDGFVVDNVVVNKWLPEVFEDAGARAVLDALNGDPEARNGLQRAVARHSRIDVEDWLRAVNLLRGQHDEHRQHLGELDAGKAKVSVVPLVPRTEGRLEAVATALYAEARP